MKPALIDAIMYLFDDASMEGNENGEVFTSTTTIQSRLEACGFNPQEINQAINWLEAFSTGFTEQCQVRSPESNSFRMLSPQECACLSTEAQFFLAEKESMGELSPSEKEFMLAQIVSLGHKEMSMEAITWIYHMTRLNQPTPAEPAASNQPTCNSYLNEQALQLVH